jgi:pyruvate formate lyase activating enzyme
VYTGNVRDREGSTTSCPGCGAVLVERHGYQVTRFRVEEGDCPDCATAIAGHFGVAPGRWGPQRVAVALEDLPGAGGHESG